MKHRRWFYIRAAVQVCCWFAFITLVVSTRDPIEDGYLYGLFPRLSLHLGIATSIAARAVLAAFLPGLAVLALSLAFGRFFCSTVCPLGATIDASDKIIARRKGALKPEIARAGRGIKYIVLVVSLILALAGVQAAGIIDPLSLSLRVYSTVVYPFFDHLAKLAFDGLLPIPGLGAAVGPLYGFLTDTVLDFNPIVFHNAGAVMLLLILILLLSLWARRFWCRYLCPLGALLALAGGFGMLRRTVDALKCVNCLRCERDCRMGAIHDRGLATIHGECVQCFECLKSCEHDAISFHAVSPFASGRADATAAESSSITAVPERPAISRRALIAGTAASLALIPGFRLNAARRADFSEIIRPPGSLPEHEFLDACIRCGACMKACPTNALHPSFLESGLEGVYTPRLIPRIGWCEKNCVLCTEVCPTGAIKKLRMGDKETTVIGTAYFLKDLCIPWAEGRECVVCEEVCPTLTKSIKFREETVPNKKGGSVRVKLPYVLEDICIGCGICENKCPVRGSAAIRVRTRKAEVPSAG
ncbi:MAG TPA: 4Fe-4S dicluster domain-containing protein [Spirochaetota bacterium]|nr:4Fe-4S dicluster domain-containing protein [Spirochaetota bacterium]